jgi:hypothetical protein
MLCGGKDTTFFAELALCSLLWGETRGLLAKKRGVLRKNAQFLGQSAGRLLHTVEGGLKGGLYRSNSQAQ